MERARLVVEQPVNIPKHDNSHKYSMQNFFSSLGYVVYFCLEVHFLKIMKGLPILHQTQSPCFLPRHTVEKM